MTLHYYRFTVRGILVVFLLETKASALQYERWVWHTHSEVVNRRHGYNLYIGLLQMLQLASPIFHWLARYHGC